MKAKFLALAYTFVLMVSQNVIAGCSDCRAENSPIAPEKTYLNLDQIDLHESSIYIQMDGKVFMVPAIYSDHHGFYIQTVKQPRGRCEPFEWKCPNCGRCNTFDDNECPSCETEMP